LCQVMTWYYIVFPGDSYTGLTLEAFGK